MARSRGRARAGLLRRRITYQRHNGTLTPNGQRDEDDANWADLFTQWSGLRPVSGAEAERARKVWAETTHLITTRRRPGAALKPSDRAKLGDRVFGIGRVLDLEDRDRTWQLLAAEDANEDAATI